MKSRLVLLWLGWFLLGAYDTNAGSSCSPNSASTDGVAHLHFSQPLPDGISPSFNPVDAAQRDIHCSGSTCDFHFKRGNGSTTLFLQAADGNTVDYRVSTWALRPGAYQQSCTSSVAA